MTDQSNASELVNSHLIAPSLLANQQHPISPRSQASPETETLLRLAAIVESSDDAIIRKTLDGTVESWNAGAERIFGYQAQEMIGQQIFLLVPDDRIDEELNILQRIKQGERIDHFETIRKCKNGTLINISLTISPIKDATGKTISASTIARDITDRKQAERRSETQYIVAQILFEESDFRVALPQILQTVCENLQWDLSEFWGMDKSTHQLRCVDTWHNSQFMKPEFIQESRSLTFTRKTGLQGRVWEAGQPIWVTDVSHDPSFFRAELAAQVGLRTACAFPVISNQSMFGVFVFFSQRIQPKIDQDWLKVMMTLGRQIGQFMQRKWAEEQLQQQAQDLQQALHQLKKTQSQLIHSEKMASLGQLVAGVAHEINNPVTFIHGNLRYAQQYTQDLLALLRLYRTEIPSTPPIIEAEIKKIDLDFIEDDIVKVFRSMQGGTERIRDIVKSLRTFSHLDEAEVKVVDLHEGIESTLMVLSSRLRKQPNCPEIQVIRRYGKLPKVECYAGQLNQVFMNILCNAIDALEESSKFDPCSPLTSEVPTIAIHTSMVGCDRVRVEFSDNGDGMTEAVRDQLFNPFFTTKPIGKGTGMGLSISFQVITERHRGSLQCISAPGQGATFIIEIPTQQPV